MTGAEVVVGGGVATAARIADAAGFLLESEGAEAVTMRRVAEQVGITAMAIYRHYPDRAGLLNALANEGFIALADQLTDAVAAGTVEERLMQVADVFLEHALANPRLYELMFLKPRAGARQYPQDFVAGRSPTFNLTVELMIEGMESGIFRRDDPWEITFELSALSHGLLVLFLGRRMGVTADSFRDLYRRSFRRYLHGIRN